MSRVSETADYLIRRYYTVTIPVLAVLVVASLIATGVVSPGNSSLIASDDYYDLNESLIEEQIHMEINEQRANRSLPRLRMDATLRTVARRHSRDMRDAGYIAHESPNGATFEDRYAAAGVTCQIPTGDGTIAVGAENIHSTTAFQPLQTENGTVYYSSESEIAQGIVGDWMDSKPHRSIILQDYWETEGVGVVVKDLGESDGWRVIVTQNFC